MIQAGVLGKEKPLPISYLSTKEDLNLSPKCPVLVKTSKEDTVQSAADTWGRSNLGEKG